jgi:hypothetical protein
MALLPSCVRCGQMVFETKVIEPAGSNYKLVTLQCAACGGVAGVLDYMNIGDRINDLEKQLDGLGMEVGRVKGSLSELVGYLQRIAQNLPQ